MYHGKHEAARPQRRSSGRKTGALIVSLLLLVALAVGSTLAYFTDTTPARENVFTPAEVSCQVEETFDGTTKSNVNVTNTSNIDAYIRVKLISYRVNEEGVRIGGTATIPGFEPGDGWTLHDGYYYYTEAVAPGGKPAADLIGSITLQEPYIDADGGKQVIEVMAEAIQAAPDEAVEEAWGVTADNGTLTFN
ncbi:MAG TPA: hypothetical protein IAC31_02450 [Candidatus Faecousia intestinigallinarum]|nr:hypothetical protein [Candidatus Faecousia intestinigallinarum]